MVEGCSPASGCSVAVEPLADTEASTALPLPSRSTKLDSVTLEEAIASLKLALRLVPGSTLVAALAGVTLDTVGGVVSTRPVSNVTSIQ